MPVLLVYGERDSSYPPDGEPRQRALFSGSPDVESVLLPGTGHAFTLERTAPLLRSAIASWLDRHGLAVAPRCRRERVVLRLGNRRAPIRSARVTVDGTRVRVRIHRGRGIARIDLRRSRPGVVVVRILVTRRDGSRRIAVRHFRRCVLPAT